MQTFRNFSQAASNQVIAHSVASLDNNINLIVYRVTGVTCSLHVYSFGQIVSLLKSIGHAACAVLTLVFA